LVDLGGGQSGYARRHPWRSDSWWFLEKRKTGRSERRRKREEEIRVFWGIRGGFKRERKGAGGGDVSHGRRSRSSRALFL
jgi:hypothetical protein